MASDSNCCPVTDIRGKALTASVESLYAVGPLDVKLTTPESSFAPSFTRTAPNAIFQRETQFGQPTTQYFGDVVKHTFKPQEMGDLLGNMYLKTTMPVLSEEAAGSNVSISFPSQFCEIIPTGESLTIAESELREIKISGEKPMIPYLARDNHLNESLTINQGSNVLSNSAIGFINFDNMILGNKIIDQEVYRSNLTTVAETFAVSANVYTTETSIIGRESTIDGGLRNFELINLNQRATKETKLFSPDSTGNISITNMPLFSIGDTPINLTATGNCAVVTDGSDQVLNPLITTVAPNIGNKFIFSANNAIVGGTQEFATNVNVNSNTVIIGGGFSIPTTFVPYAETSTTTNGAGEDATVIAETVSPTNVNIIDKGYGYRPGDLLTASLPTGAGEDIDMRNYTPSFQYKSNVYMIGGGDPAFPTSNCYKRDLSTIPAAYGAAFTPDPILLENMNTSFATDFYAGGVAHDTDNNYVYLFGPDNGTNLWRIGFDALNHKLTGSWTQIVPATGFDYTTITGENGTHNTPISYSQGSLHVLGGLRDVTTDLVTQGFRYDLLANQWNLFSLYSSVGPVVVWTGHYPRATQQISPYVNGTTDDIDNTKVLICTQIASGAVNSCDKAVIFDIDTASNLYWLVTEQVDTDQGGGATTHSSVEYPIISRCNLSSTVTTSYYQRMDYVICNTAQNIAPYQYVDTSANDRMELDWGALNTGRGWGSSSPESNAVCGVYNSNVFMFGGQTGGTEEDKVNYLLLDGDGAYPATQNNIGPSLFTQISPVMSNALTFSSTFNWIPGDRNKVLGERDMLSYATIEYPNTTLADNTVIAQFGKDLSIVYHDDGVFSTLAGGSNVLTNTSGVDTRKIDIRTSSEYFYFGTNLSGGYTNAGRTAMRNMIWQGRNLLYRCDYRNPPSTTSNLFNNWYENGVEIEQSDTFPSTLSLYSNASDTNIITLATNWNSTNGVFTTPPGMRFMRSTLPEINFNFDPSKYKMDGSFFPLFSFSGPAGNLKITFGGQQNTGITFPAFTITTLIEDFRPGGETYLIKSSNNFWYDTSTPKAIGFPLNFWLGCGQVGDGAAATFGYRPWTIPSNILFAFTAGPDIDILALSAISKNLTAGPAKEIPPDQDFIDAMQFGGLEVEVFDSDIGISIYGAYTTHDLYKSNVLIGQVNAYSNHTTVTYGSNWWDESDLVNGNLITITNGSDTNVTNAFTTDEMSNIVALSTTQQAFPSFQANVAYPITFFEEGRSGTGAPASIASNVYITPTVYGDTFITKTSNGYANVLTTVGPEIGPIPFQNKQIDISFYANNNTTHIDNNDVGYSQNVFYIKNEYAQRTFVPSELTAQTILDIRYPSNASTINIASNPGGNIWSYYTNNFAEYEQGLFPTNTLRFEEPGYDVIYDDKWQLTGLGNTVSITTHMGSFENRVAGQLDSNTASAFFTTGVNSVITNPYSQENFVQQYNLDTELVSSKESYPGNTYPMSMLSITLSTANRLPITYVSTSDYKDKLSLLPPTDLTMNVYSSGGTEPVGGDTTLNLWYDTTYTVFSGPTPVSVDESSIDVISGTTKNYNTNVAYTSGNIEIFSNAVSNATHSFKTYEPQTELEFHTYANTMTLGTTTVDLSNRSNVAYDEFLRSSNLYYNSQISIGEAVDQVEDFFPTRYNATFQHLKSVFFIGGGKKELGQSSSKCYKVKLDDLNSPVGGGDSVAVIPLTPDFPFAFYGGQCTLDTDNNYVYLFCPNNTNDLYKIEFDPVDEILVGSWSLVSTTWFYTNVQGNPITYCNGKLWNVGSYYPTLGYNNKLYYAYSFDIATGSWSSTYYTNNASYPRRSLQVLLPGTNKILCLAKENSGGKWADRILIFDTDNIAAGPEVVAKDASGGTTTWFWPAMYAAPVSQTGPVGTSNQDVILYQSTQVTDGNVVASPYYSYIDTTTSTLYTSSIAGGDEPNPTYDQINEFTCGSLVSTSSIYIFGGEFASGNANRMVQMEIVSGASAKFEPGPAPAVSPILEIGEIEYYNSPFVGPTNYGNIPIVTSGIRYADKLVPFFTLTDQAQTSNIMEYGIRRSNVYTALEAPSSRENKGQFNTWYLNSTTSNNEVIADQGWSGKDPGGNFSQKTPEIQQAIVEDQIVPVEYTPNFQYKSNVFMIGGGAAAAPTSYCYKCDLHDTPVSPTGSPDPSNVSCIYQTEFPSAFYAGGATFDSDNSFVYLFGPDNGTNLWRIGFDTLNHEFTGSWQQIVPDTGFDYTTITGENGTHNTPISYYNGCLYVLGGLRDDTTLAVTNAFKYDLFTNKWSLFPLQTPGGAVFSHYPRATPQVNPYGSAWFSSTTVNINEIDNGRILLCTQIASGAVNSCDKAVIMSYDTYSSTLHFNAYVQVDTDQGGGATTHSSVENPIISRCNLSSTVTSTYYKRMDFVIFNTATGINKPYQYIWAVGDDRMELDWNAPTPYWNVDNPVKNSICGTNNSNVYIFGGETGSTSNNKVNYLQLYSDGTYPATSNNSPSPPLALPLIVDTTTITDSVLDGPVWPADALNDRTKTSYVYDSQIVFQSTTNASAEYMTFQTSNIADSNSRAPVVYNNVLSSNVQYSNLSLLNQYFFDYTVDGITPYTSASTGAVTIKNSFNQFQSGEFVGGYPVIEACYDTDNSPTTLWRFEFLDPAGNQTLDGVSLSPPTNASNGVANVIINDNYRQYLPSQINRTGRLDEVTFTYGSSRDCTPDDVELTTATLQYGLYRSNLVTEGGVVDPTDPNARVYSTVAMKPRKLTLCSFETGLEGQQSTGNKIEIYKYYSNLIPFTGASESFAKDKGFYDEIIVSFGFKTTSSGEKETINLNPAKVLYADDATQETTKFDPIKVTFSDYNPETLEVTANIFYRHFTSSFSYSVESNIALSADAYNMLSDEFGRSGNVIITSTFNSGIISSNLDYGVRPVCSNINDSDATNTFSTNLWSTNLGAWEEYEYNAGGAINPITNVAQENVYSEVFPVNIKMQKYDPSGIYANKIGRAIIKEVTLSINGQEFQKLDDLWYITHDELFKTDDDKEGLDNLINGGQEYIPTSPINYGPIDLYVPLDLFFCRTRRTSSTEIVPKKVFDENRTTNPYLPLCAMTNQEIELAIEFYPQEYFTNTSTRIDLSYLNTSIITEEVTVSDKERLYYMHNPIEFQIETAKRFPKQLMSLTIPNTPQKFEGFVADFPVKMVNWLFRSRQFEDLTSSEYFLHRYNFSTVVSTDEQYRLFFQFLEKADFFIEGIPQVERYGTGDFFRYLQTLKSGLYPTDKNIYSYAMSLYPQKMSPSGSLNFSETNSNKTFLQFKLDPKDQSTTLTQVDLNAGVTMHGYAYGYNILKIKDNTVFKVFS